MTLTAAFATWLAFELRGDFAYSLRGGRPLDLGGLDHVPVERLPRNAWVRAEGTLSTEGVIRFRRPLDPDAHRLAPLETNPNVWVELRVPPDADGDRFVAPGSFVGRLVPVANAGLRYGALEAAVADAGKGPLPAGSFLLLDGESPATTRWVLALVLVLAGFAAFNIAGIVRLARPVRDA
jgi:hypothetical protein